TERRAFPGVIATSPASIAAPARRTSTPCSGCQGRSSAEAERIASGAKRAPARQLVVVSKGIPTTAAAARTSPLSSLSRLGACAAEASSRVRASASTAWGRPANVRRPAKRGARRGAVIALPSRRIHHHAYGAQQSVAGAAHAASLFERALNVGQRLGREPLARQHVWDSRWIGGQRLSHYPSGRPGRRH